MADEEMAVSWKDVEKMLDKGKTEGALELLRKVDPEGTEATTLRLAGKAIHMQAVKSGSSSEYRKSAKLLRDAVKMNPRDKQSNSLYNQIRNEMQDKGISETVIPRLLNNGTPTPAGLFAVTAALLVVLGGLQFIGTTQEFEDGEAIMRITWTDNAGVFHDENITIALHRAEAPLHVENFILLSQSGRYNNVIFHRVIDNFMIQSGDFEYNNGQGGYTGTWYGYCNGQTTDADGNDYTAETCALSQWSLPGEHENGLKHGPGSLAAAHAGLNTDGSQFYIVPSDSTPSHLDWNENKDCTSQSCHTVYGTVTEGLEFIDSISSVPTPNSQSGSGGDKPINDVTIVSVIITDDGIKDTEDPWYQFW